MIEQIIEALTMMDWNIVLAEIAGAALLVILGCLAWSKIRIYRVPVADALYRPEKNELREFRTAEQMKRYILEAIHKLEPDQFNLAGMFMVQGDFEQLGGAVEPTYLGQLDALLRAEGLGLLLPEREAPIAINKPLWFRPHALDYYLFVANSQTAGITQEMREGARRFMYIWMRCATTGMKLELGMDYTFSDLKHRRWVARRMIHYAAFLLNREGSPHGLLEVDAATIPERYIEFDALDFTDEECDAASSQVIRIDAA